jgi:ABC-type transport system substrate-binding protein
VGAGLFVTGAAALAVACGGKEEQPAAKGTAAPSGTQAAAPATATTAAQMARGGILRAQIPNVFDSTDVHRALGDPTLWTSNYVYNKLVMYKNPDTGELEPDLSEKYEAVDAATYIFNLRKGVKLHPPHQPRVHRRRCAVAYRAAGRWQT